MRLISRHRGTSASSDRGGRRSEIHRQVASALEGVVQGVVRRRASVFVRTLAIEAERKTLGAEILGWPRSRRPNATNRADLLVLSVGQLGLVALVLPLVGEELTGRVENVAAVRSYAVDMIADARKATLFEWTRLRLHELLEPVPGQLLVFDMVGFVFVCANKR